MIKVVTVKNPNADQYPSATTATVLASTGHLVVSRGSEPLAWYSPDEWRKATKED